MSDRRFTLFELHTHGDVQVGPATLRSGSETDEETTSGDETRGPQPLAGTGLPFETVLKLVAAVAVLVAGAKIVGKAADQVGRDQEGTDVEIEAEAAESTAD